MSDREARALVGGIALLTVLGVTGWALLGLLGTRPAPSPCDHLRDCELILETGCSDPTDDLPCQLVRLNQETDNATD